MFGITKINVYPVPDFNYETREPCMVWRVDVRHSGGGISTEYRNPGPLTPGRTTPVAALVRLASADEGETEGRYIAERMGVKRVWVRKFHTYEDFLNRWIP